MQAAAPTPEPAASNLPSTSGYVSPEVLRPFGKRAAKQVGSTQRKKGKSAIYTDTPIKKILEQEREINRKAKVRKQLIGPSALIKKGPKAYM